MILKLFTPLNAHCRPEIMSESTTARFVIQKHSATHLHYDFRLELDGVLKSWAIPKEPPSEAGIKRLAVQVEDHDLNYIGFEGMIPKGEYGAGKVEVWDKGTFKLKYRTQDKIMLTLDGSKLTGDYTLLRFKKNENWLFFKNKTNEKS
jgi:DNA ligase D-like protein (predicted 3'-phosphoesterase)